MVTISRSADDVNNMADTHQVSYQDKFTSVPLDSGQLDKKKGKVPKRVIHFSDGVLEEYSTDEEDSVDSKPTTVIDPKTLTWLPWCTHYATTAAKMSLGVAELCGEKLAWLFGITSPKYGYAIEEYKRVAKEAADEDERVEKLKQSASANAAFDVKVVGDGKEISSATNDKEAVKDAADKY